MWGFNTFFANSNRLQLRSLLRVESLQHTNNVCDTLTEGANTAVIYCQAARKHPPEPKVLDLRKKQQ